MKPGYARASTTDQNLAIQRVRLHEAGCEMLFEEMSSGISKKRPELERLPTELDPYIGYERAAEGAKTRCTQGETLREVVVEKGLMSGESFDELVVPAQMPNPRDPGLSAAVASCHPPTEEGGGSAVTSFNLSMLGLRPAAGGKSLWRE